MVVSVLTMEGKQFLLLSAQCKEELQLPIVVLMRKNNARHEKVVVKMIKR